MTFPLKFVFSWKSSELKQSLKFRKVQNVSVRNNLRSKKRCSCYARWDFRGIFTNWERPLHRYYEVCLLNSFYPSIVFQTETSHLICSVNLMTGFYMEHSTSLKRVNGELKIVNCETW